MPKTRNKQLVFEVLLAILLAALLIVTLVTELIRADDAISYERVDLVTYVSTDVLTGYIFREESAPGTLNNGPIDYRVTDGFPVQAGTELARVYRDDTGTDKRAKAAALYAEIAQLEGALAATAGWQGSYLSHYTALMRQLSAAQTGSAADAAQQTALAIAGRDAQQETNAEAIRAQIGALRAELDAMTVHTDDYMSAKADFDGVFYHAADGYEATFGLQAAQALTPTTLQELLAAPQDTANTVGKLVSAGTWYLVLPTEGAVADTYLPETVYNVRFTGGIAPMTLTRIARDAESGNALLILRADSMPTFLDGARRQSVTLEKQTVRALSVPADTISESNTVFILSDGVARLRHVTPLVQEHGCLLLYPEQGEYALHAGDLVIVSTKQLFDGKVLSP